jgi:Uma2 family endonuclease
MAEPAKRSATYADLEAVPEHLVAELIDGDLVTRPRPSPRHSAAANSLSGELTGPFQNGRGGPGGWVFFVEPELKLGSDILVPDIARWRRERLPAYPETNYFTSVPDWVCEVFSASTERRDRTVKNHKYAKAGIACLWIVDPRQQLLEAFTLVDNHWLLRGAWSSDDNVAAPPFDAISFSLADLWPLDRPLGFAEDPQHLYAGDR